ncbi:MAG: sugar phosphate nucleotidyltransferase [Pelolinea sp.]|nr:sugar phosphate nucleotidyltransferase [Pelolinea sp.]
MNDNYYAVIMAGGGGTRLWPLSTKSRPKQLLNFQDNKSLFTLAIDRLKGLFKQENIYVVTIADQVPALREQVPELSLDQFIIEPQPRGTASVVGLAAINLLGKNTDAVMAVLTADHIIENVPLFHDLLKSAYILADQNHLITIGIESTYAATGYGYIKTGNKLNLADAFIVEKFVEKPDEKTASQYLQDGSYYWNSGMFIWRADRILKEFKRQMLDLYSKLNLITDLFNKTDFRDKFLDIWSSIKPETIDYGIMEKAEDVLMLKAESLGWNDVGCWDSLYEFLPPNNSGNVIKNKNSVLIDSKDILLFGENDNKIIASLGVEDLVIIDTEKALLVCKKGETQRIKQVIEEIKNKNLDRFL